MKEQFPGYFRPTQEEFDYLWQNCLFCFDTNTLTNLYRFSDSTRQDFLRILRHVPNRLWLPHQVVEEYFHGRLGVVWDEGKTYDQTLKDIENLENAVKNDRKHPFLSPERKSELTDVLDKVKDELQKNGEEYKEKLHSDPIQDELSTLFHGRVGSEYTDEQLEKIFSEGEKRYAEEQPPGFKDKDKLKDDRTVTKKRGYGDLIIWEQIKEKSKQEKTPIIFVTDDSKDDWWLNFRGITVSPHPELIQEFRRETYQMFYMYHSGTFMEQAARYMRIDMEKESVKEAEDLARHWRDVSEKGYSEWKREKNEGALESIFWEEIKSLEDERRELEDQIERIEEVMGQLEKRSIDRNDVSALQAADMKRLLGECHDKRQELLHVKREIEANIESKYLSSKYRY